MLLDAGEMPAPDEFEHLIDDLKKQRDQLQGQMDSFSHRERTTSELLNKLQELRNRADDTASVKLGRIRRAEIRTED